MMVVNDDDDNEVMQVGVNVLLTASLPHAAEGERRSDLLQMREIQRNISYLWAFVNIVVLNICIVKCYTFRLL